MPETLFMRTPDGYDGQGLRWSRFSMARWWKKLFFLDFQQFFWGGSVNRDSVKELIYQKKNGGHQASKRIISM